jgi:hypothetical protein
VSGHRFPESSDELRREERLRLPGRRRQATLLRRRGVIQTFIQIYRMLTDLLPTRVSPDHEAEIFKKPDGALVRERGMRLLPSEPGRAGCPSEGD